MSHVLCLRAQLNGDSALPNMSLFPGLGVAFVPSAPASLSFNLAPSLYRPNRACAPAMAMPLQQHTQAAQGCNGVAGINGQSSMGSAGTAGEFAVRSDRTSASFDASRSPIGAPVKSPLGESFSTAHQAHSRIATDRHSILGALQFGAVLQSGRARQHAPERLPGLALHPLIGRLLRVYRPMLTPFFLLFFFPVRRRWADG